MTQEPLLAANRHTKSILAVVAAGVLSWAGWVSLTLIETEELALKNRELLAERSQRLVEIFDEFSRLNGELSAIRDGQLETRALIIDALDIAGDNK